jgi:hypothetical protein
MIRSPRGGRGGERGTVDKNNRYRLLQGLGDTGSPDRVVTRGMSRGRDERVDGRIRDAGEKRTLDERSPGDHGVGERNPRARVMSGDRRSSNRWEEDEEEMGEGGEEEVTRRDEGTADREREERNRREQERQEEIRREEERVNREREEERLRREREERETRGSGRVGMNEFQIGEIFRKIDEKMVQAMDEVIGREPDEVMLKVKAGMQVMLDGMRQVMSAVSDSVANERYEKRLENTEVLDRFNKVDEEVKSLNRVAEYWKETESVTKVKESEREMEEKVKAASCSLKLLDLDFGYATDDKREMVRQVVNMFRGDIPPTDRNSYDRIMRKTRVAILGKRTELRSDRERNRSIHTVPVLLECQNKSDRDELEYMLKKAGYFPTFHWPTEMLEFIGGVREELRKIGFADSYYVRVRPEEKNGQMQIRADVKLKNGGRFQPKAFWKCPPLQREFWSLIEGLYTPRLVGQ